MIETTQSLQRKIKSAKDLRTVVSAMKSLAASSIVQYEKSVSALIEYNRNIELGLGACFHESGAQFFSRDRSNEKSEGELGVIVFGSDQGLVGQFNEILCDFVVKSVKVTSQKTSVGAVGERIHSRLQDAALPPRELFSVPNSVEVIADLVSQILLKIETLQTDEKNIRIAVFYNRPKSGASYIQVRQQLLPLDQSLLKDFSGFQWPTKNLPEILNGVQNTLPAFIHEYLFIVLFRACAESLASENASRLAAMQRAEKNIDELLVDLGSRFHHLRQSKVDEELFDVVSGFEALVK